MVERMAERCESCLELLEPLFYGDDDFENADSSSNVEFLSKSCQTSKNNSTAKRNKHTLINNNYKNHASPFKRSLHKKKKYLPPLIKSKFAPMTIQTKHQFFTEYQCDPSRKYYNVKDTDDFDNLTSCIHIISRVGANYRLTFNAEKASMEPLFIRPRSPPPNLNEKTSQITSRMQLYDDPLRLNCVVIKRPKYILRDGADIPEKSQTAMKVYSVNPHVMKDGANSISKPSRSRTIGFIYVNIDDIIIKVRVQPLPITKIRLPITNDIRSTMERLKMPCSEEFKNKGKLLVRLGDDLLRLNFDLTNCKVSKLPEHKSMAVQTENHTIILQQYSNFKKKLVNLQLPESTYVYRDPMVDIRRMNCYFRKMKITPLWKYEMHQKRLAQIRDPMTMEGKITKVIKRARGSVVSFDGFDATVTATGGLMCGMVVKGNDSYEEKIKSYLVVDKKHHARGENAEDSKNALVTLDLGPIINKYQKRRVESVSLDES